MEWECVLCGETAHGARPRTCAVCGTAGSHQPLPDPPPEPGSLRALWLELGLRAERFPIDAAGSSAALRPRT